MCRLTIHPGGLYLNVEANQRTYHIGCLVERQVAKQVANPMRLVDIGGLDQLPPLSRISVARQVAS